MVSLGYLCDLWSLHTSKTLLNSFTRHGLLTERFYISIRSFESGKWSIDTSHVYIVCGIVYMMGFF